MSTRTISDDSLTVTVRRAQVSDSIRLSDLQEQGTQANEAHPLRKLYREHVYPLVCACIMGEVPDFETFLSWPEEFAQKCYAAVRELNPHWFARETPDPKASPPPTPSTDA